MGILIFGCSQRKLSFIKVSIEKVAKRVKSTNPFHNNEIRLIHTKNLLKYKTEELQSSFEMFKSANLKAFVVYYQFHCTEVKEFQVIKTLINLANQNNFSAIIVYDPPYHCKLKCDIFDMQDFTFAVKDNWINCFAESSSESQNKLAAPKILLMSSSNILGSKLIGHITARQLNTRFSMERLDRRRSINDFFGAPKRHSV